jgi:hypothetical protein
MTMVAKQKRIGLYILLFFTAYYGLLLSSCLTPREKSTWTPAVVTVEQPGTTVYVLAPCPAASPPVPPKVTWLPDGCPPKYGACLAGEDAGAVAAYLEATRRWMAEARKCDRAR